MTKKLYLMVISSLFLLIGISAITFIFAPITNTLSISQENKDNNILFANNINNLQLNNTINSSALKQLGLYPLHQHMNNTISSLMTIAENPLNGSTSFENFPLVNLTNEMKSKYHGIPSDQDLEKRSAVKEVLASNKALLVISLLLPNGDRYFGEPYYPYQTNGSIYNFAHQDHFKGASEAKKPHLSNVIKAATTGEPIAILASPIYSNIENKDSLIGIQILALNLSHFNDLVKSALSTGGEGGDSNKRAVIVDNNGTKIADSSSSNYNNDTGFFKELQSFQNAKNGNSGLLIEEVNGKNMSIAYTSIKFAQTDWIVLLLSSFNN